jgi:hypothetical protein
MVNGAYESDGDEHEDVCGVGTYVDMDTIKSTHGLLR